MVTALLSIVMFWAGLGSKPAGRAGLFGASGLQSWEPEPKCGLWAGLGPGLGLSPALTAFPKAFHQDL